MNEIIINLEEKNDKNTEEIAYLKHKIYCLDDIHEKYNV